MLVLVTTVVDRDSYAHLEEYREMLRLRNVELFVLSFARRFPSGPGTSFLERMNRYYFRHLVEETSGRFYLVDEFRYLDSLMVDLQSRLENSYTAGFYVRPNKPPREHSARLEIRRPEVEIIHRKTVVY